MTADAADPTRADGRRTVPLASALALLSPDRAVLVGAAGPTVATVARWSLAEPGVRVRRGSGPTGVHPGDLVVTEAAHLLPAPAPGLAAVVPGAERDAACALGWTSLTGTDEGFAVLAAGTRDEAPTPGAYRRERAALSRALARLALTSPEPSLVAPPITDPPPVPAAPLAVTARDTVSIIVPVHGAAPELRRCLDSLIAHTTWPSELWVIDDASADPDVDAVLAELSGLEHVHVLRNAINLGFTATVNRGLRVADGDVVLLNSDAEVGPRWLEQLLDAARSRPGVATVTPVSDNAGAFSVPAEGTQPLAPALDTASAARLLAQGVRSAPIDSPTGNGFCLLIRREALQTVGGFDEHAFPRGYGEENDFCMRAAAAGFVSLVDGRTFVGHARGRSFGSERDQLAAAGRARLDQRHPDYTARIREFASGAALAMIRAEAAAALAERASTRPRVLYVLPEGGGGMTFSNRDLVGALSQEYDPWLLTSDRRTLRLWRAGSPGPVQEEEATLDRPLRPTDYSRADYREIVERWVRAGAFELVHVRHLFKHTFDLPAIAHQLGIPLVVSFHDFYFVCPTFHLLDDRDHYCAGRCSEGDGRCRLPDAGLDELPHLKHAYVHQWRAEATAALRHADALVTTSPHARAVHRRALPALSQIDFEVIPHGRSLRQHATLARRPDPGEPVRLLIIANLDVHKGADYLRAMRAAPGGDRIELHLLGTVRPGDADLGVVHGPFDREQLAAHVDSIQPAFAGCFSVVAETWSHSLTEAWSLGLPVIATDLGALGERVRAHGGGVLVPVDDPAAAVTRILELAADPTAWGALRDAATVRGCPSLEAMADGYRELYRRARDQRRTLAAPPSAPVAMRRRRGVASLLALVAGESRGVHPGSVFVRVLRRWDHPAVAERVSLRLRAPEDDPVRPGTDVVLVQRTAVESALTPSLLQALGERSIPLMLDLDDDLLDPARPDPLTGADREALLATLAAAALVMVPHERLARRLQPFCDAVSVVPNLIDERLFLSGIRERPRALDRAPRAATVELVYVGSPTHGPDLALLAPVLAALEDLAPGRFRLTVVGGERPGPGQQWYRRLTVPDQCKPYPAFVGWLRTQRPQWDIALAPLCDTPFNRHKSDLKHLEYSALGLPAVYSDLDPYASVADGQTGLRVPAHDPGAWAQAILMLADDPPLAGSIAKRAFERVCAEHLVRHGADQLLEALATALGPRAGV